MKNKSQYSYCPLCNQKKEAIQTLCLKCIRNPFKIEYLRDFFAKKKDFVLFQSLYSSKYPEIKNINTGKFWDHRFNMDAGYNDQDAMTKEKIDAIISFIPKNAKILDLGFGQGYLEDRLQQKGKSFTIWGVDISPLSVIRAKKFKGTFILGDVFEMDKKYKKNFFDVIVALEVVEHISPKNIFTFYKKVYSLLKKDGVVIISTPINEGLEFMDENPNAHVRTYTEDILRMEMKLHGLNVIETKTHYAFQRLYSLKKMIALIFPNRWKPNNIIIVARKK